MRDERAPRRIAMVIGEYTPAIEGAGIQAQRLAEEMTRRGHRVAVLTGRWDSALPDEEVVNGVMVRRLGTLRGGFGVRGLRGIGRTWFLRGIERELADLAENIDVIHVHQLLEPAVSAVAAGEKIEKPVIATTSSAGMTSDPAELRQRRGDQAWLRLCEGLRRLVAIDSCAAQEAVRAGFPRQRIAQIPNGVPAPSWRKEDHREDRHIVCVSRCRPEKGLDALLPAFERLSRRVAGLRLDLVGGGEDLPKLRIMADSRGLSHSVRFHGDVNDVQPFLKDASVFVLPSRAEGISNALLEAMAVGLPCVATAVGGNTELIDHGRTGLLCAAEDPDALAGALESLLADESLRTRLGTEARQKIERGYTIGAVATRYERLYSELAGDGE